MDWQMIGALGETLGALGVILSVVLQRLSDNSGSSRSETLA
jgi:hypothetical protein